MDFFNKILKNSFLKLFCEKKNHKQEFWIWRKMNLTSLKGKINLLILNLCFIIIIIYVFFLSSIAFFLYFPQQNILDTTTAFKIWKWTNLIWEREELAPWLSFPDEWVYSILRLVFMIFVNIFLSFSFLVASFKNKLFVLIRENWIRLKWGDCV